MCPTPAGAHLQHQEPGVGVGLQHRVRVAQLVVERAGRRHGRPEPASELGDQVLGGGLAGRAGQRRRRSARAAGRARAGEPRHRGQRVVDHDHRHAVERPGAEHRRPPRPPARPAGEVVPVDLLAGERDEQPARADLARVELDGAGRPGAAGRRRRAGRRPPRPPRRGSAGSSAIVCARPGSPRPARRRSAPRPARPGRRTGGPRRRSPGRARGPCRARAITSPGPARRTASSIAARRPATSTTSARAAGRRGARRAPRRGSRPGPRCAGCRR